MASIWNIGRSRSESQTCDTDMPEKKAVPLGIIVAGDFKIDSQSRSASVCGRQVQLSAAEFDVLVYLTTHRKQVVTSQTTLAIKSKDQGVRQTEFLRNLLSLRKKLQEEVPDAHYVQTEALVLYDFDPGTHEEKGV
jgi:DNA-binding response OmpR family regulator